MPAPKSSVIICNYNCAKFFPDAIDSVFRQNMARSDYEILVVDDGSQDSSRETIKPYVPQIKAVFPPHKSQAAALNAVLPFCQGRWISFLESDDVWTPAKLRESLRELENDPGLVSLSHSMRQADARLKHFPTVFPARDAIWGFDDFLNGRTAVTGLSALTVRRDSLEKLLPLPEDLTTCVDEYLHPRLLRLGGSKHLAAPLGLRRIHENNFYAGMEANPERIETYLALREILDRRLDDFLKQSNSDLAPQFKRQRLRKDLETRFFLARWRKRRLGALKFGARTLYLCGPRPYALFKAVALFCAFMSPKLYFALYKRYEASPRLAELRSKVMP